MPRGDKSSYTDKLKRQAEHIHEGYEGHGVPEREAERRAWATVNKQDHGGRRAGQVWDAPRIPLHHKKADISELGLPQTVHRLQDQAPRRRPPLRGDREGAEPGVTQAQSIVS